MELNPTSLPELSKLSRSSKNLRETKDCLVKFRNKVTSDGKIDASELDAIDKNVLKLIEESVVEAKSAPKPAKEELLTDVYVSY